MLTGVGSHLAPNGCSHRRNACETAPSVSRREGGALSHDRQPDWLEWELELGDHVCDRMVERGLDEIDLRIMLEEPHLMARDAHPGRWRIAARTGRRRWIMVVEPDSEARRLAVVTVFAVD